MRIRSLRPLLLTAALCTVSACASNGPVTGRAAGAYVGGVVPIECVPFARALSGIRLSGSAADWWRQSDGHYYRSITPRIGSVLVFRRSSRLPEGHVAVVSQVLGPRAILVTQANWVHHRISEDQPVIDTSTMNDWSSVRVWWPPLEEMGITEYPAFGFILSGRRATHEGLLAATPRAIRLAANE